MSAYAGDLSIVELWSMMVREVGVEAASLEEILGDGELREDHRADRR